MVFQFVLRFHTYTLTKEEGFTQVENGQKMLFEVFGGD